MNLKLATALTIVVGGLLTACLQSPQLPTNSSGAMPATNLVRAQAVTSANVYVDWGQVQRTATSSLYGVGLFGGSTVVVSDQPSYKTNLSYFKPGIVRYHRAEMMNDSATNNAGWVDVANRRWDEVRIKRVMDNLDDLNSSAYNFYKPAKLVNIPGWPSWMKTVRYNFADGNYVDLLDPIEYDNYAAFCAQLVTILKNQGRNVQYYTPTNEKDGSYYVSFASRNLPDRLDDLITIYNKAAVAMKQADPSIQVGGLEFERGDLVKQVRRFVRGANANLDFVAYHFYANDEPYAAAESVYNRTQDGSRHGLDIVNILREEGSSAKVFGSEFNINYAARQDYKMTLSEGAVYDALIFIGSLDNGIPATMAWNDRDGYYGKLDNNDGGNNIRVGAHNMQLFGNYMVGERVTSTSDNGAVVTMAVRTGSRKSVALVNRSSSSQTVALRFSPTWSTASAISRYIVAPAPAYYYGNSVSFADLSNLTLEPNSVSVLTVADSQTVTSSSAELSRQGWTASASSSGGGSPALAIDASVSTRWSTGAAQTPGQWFQLDLGSSKTFDRITLDLNGQLFDYPRRFEIYATNDPNNLGTALPTGAGVSVNGSIYGTGGGVSGGLTTIDFAPVTKRYLRIVQQGTDMKWWWSINEARIYSHSIGTSTNVNLIVNPSFQAEGATQTPSGWNTWSPNGAFNAADYTETNLSRDGTLHGTHWFAGAYTVATYQTITNLANGLYTMRAWVKSYGGQTSADMYVKNYGGTEVSVRAPSDTWTQVTLRDINVTNGSAEVGFYSDSDALAKRYLMFDDVEFFKQ